MGQIWTVTMYIASSLTPKKESNRFLLLIFSPKPGRLNMATRILFLVLLFICSSGNAYDPSPLQDFCVADLKSPVLVNGFVCKNPNLAQANDFFFAGLDKPGNTSNPLGLGVTPVTATQIPGLNTLGISSVRIDYALNGLNPPHTHPRATEILVVLKGILYAGFVTSNPENRLFTKVLKKGDVFVFPIGLIHFQLNVGETNAVAISSLSSQNPGVITIANAVFRSKPQIHEDVLTKAFQVDKKVIDALQAHF
ncbi:putative germin-like protein 2-1 [Cinnamomum micranthum f. kanehirae]|uniref:Germin-like protein n=1 Tax=Cinnamomum micranthum f. kanehirae TaxID=337451 RepID=A0A443PCZ8_9MAGN|nr:putative germin-like protein 2-1 [Cinnamomum micranthum f. kanehirae]